MKKDSKILITGGTGLAGKNLTHYLLKHGYNNVKAMSSKECNLTDQMQTNAFFDSYKPEYVFHLAAYVNGIMGNMLNKGKAFYINSLINLNVIEACRIYKVKKITAMGTGAAYPVSNNLLKENEIWNGPPHSSEDAYAHAKRAMYAQLCAYKEDYNLDFAFVISTNLYGPHDNFDTKQGHVIPSLIKKFYDAQINGNADMMAWGNGTAKRDFIYADDFAKALELIMTKGNGAINMSSGYIHTIKDITDILSDLTSINVKWDSTKPNGQSVRIYDITKLQDLGFKSSFSLEEGIKLTYKWLTSNIETARVV